MTHEKLTPLAHLKKNVRNKLLTGILVILPIYITFFIVKFLFQFIGGNLAPFIKRLFERQAVTFPDIILNPLVITIGLIITFVALYFIGVFATNFLGKRMLVFMERLIENTPVVKSIYSSAKQVIHTISLPQKAGFKRVVVVEFPRVGMNMLGFVTGAITNRNGETLTSVFVPTTPNPTTGFLVYLPERGIKDTTFTVEEGFKMIISGGILVPRDGVSWSTEGVAKKVEDTEVRDRNQVS